MGGFKMGAKSSSPFKKTQSHMEKMQDVFSKINFNEYGRMGVVALSDATPKDSGETANSWDYFVEKTKDGVRITWTNDNVVGDNTVPVAILIQYGHLSKAGVYVEGRDFINPAMMPIYNEIADKIWKEVNKV